MNINVRKVIFDREYGFSSINEFGLSVFCRIRLRFEVASKVLKEKESTNLRKSIHPTVFLLGMLAFFRIAEAVSGRKCLD